MDWKQWYDSLEKPNWTPEPATIGFIWQCLYPVILVTFSFVFWKAIRREIPWQVALPFAINLFANLIFTPIQFGLRNLPLAPLIYSSSGAPSSGCSWLYGNNIPRSLSLKYLISFGFR